MCLCRHGNTCHLDHHSPPLLLAADDLCACGRPNCNYSYSQHSRGTDDALTSSSELAINCWNCSREKERSSRQASCSTVWKLFAGFQPPSSCINVIPFVSCNKFVACLNVASKKFRTAYYKICSNNWFLLAMRQIYARLPQTSFPSTRAKSLSSSAR